MFALVRFVSDLDKRPHVIPVSDIEALHPTHETDFDGKALYVAFWRDPAGKASGSYSVQVLMLAETKEEVEKKMSAKRIIFPKLHIEDMEEEIDSPDEASVDLTQKRKAEKKKQQQNKAAAKKTMYDEMLRKNLEGARKMNSEALKEQDTAIGRKRASKRARCYSESSSESESDSLCSRSELLQAMKDTKQWKEKARSLQEDKAFLQAQVESLQRCLESKIFELEQLQATGKQHPAAGEPGPSFINKLLPERSRGRAVAMPSSSCNELDCPPATAPPRTAPGTSKLPPLPVASEPSCQLAEGRLPLPRPALASPPASTSEQPCHALQPRPDLGDVQDFSFLEDGSFHLASHLVVTGAVARKILGNKKPTLVVKDTAQAIWGDVLVTRSVTGALAPRKKTLGETAKDPLTPTKVEVVAATLKHWGRAKGVDVQPTLSVLVKLLAEKIQDTIKSRNRVAKLLAVPSSEASSKP